jgi:hypothetical protein
VALDIKWLSKKHSSNMVSITTPSGKSLNQQVMLAHFTWMEELIKDNRVVWRMVAVLTLKKNFFKVMMLKKELHHWQFGLTKIGHNQKCKKNKKWKAILHVMSLWFDTPKPVNWLTEILKLGSKKRVNHPLVWQWLLHAVMALNG